MADGHACADDREFSRRLLAAGEPTRLILIDPTVDTSKRDNSVLLSNVEVFRRSEDLFARLAAAGRAGRTAPPSIAPAQPPPMGGRPESPSIARTSDWVPCSPRPRALTAT